jgi:hypothetical protein
LSDEVFSVTIIWPPGSEAERLNLKFAVSVKVTVILSEPKVGRVLKLNVMSALFTLPT